jgi:nucleoside-diphosphate-sugar epimerase
MPGVLVTGASGFVGRHLVRELERAGWRVASCGRRELGPHTAWRDALEGNQAVVHLAAIAHERATACERARDYETLRRVNVHGTERLAREAAAAGVRHFVFASSIGVCGDETHGLPFTEASAPAPRSLYAKSKLDAEQALAAVSASTGLAVTMLRPTLIYGPGNGGNFLRLLRAVESAWPLPLAAIRNRRNLAYVDNVVSAIVAALAHPEATGPLVVCDAEAVSTPDLVARLAHAMGRPARLFPLPPGALLAAGRVFGKGDMVRRLVASLEADCGKARRVLAWQPRVSASEGLARTAAWYRGQAEKKHVEASG